MWNKTLKQVVCHCSLQGVACLATGNKRLHILFCTATIGCCDWNNNLKCKRTSQVCHRVWNAPFSRYDDILVENRRKKPNPPSFGTFFWGDPLRIFRPLPETRVMGLSDGVHFTILRVSVIAHARRTVEWTCPAKNAGRMVSNAVTRRLFWPGCAVLVRADAVDTSPRRDRGISPVHRAPTASCSSVNSPLETTTFFCLFTRRDNHTTTSRW